MKKLFRIPIIIILFLGGGFLYVVKNPTVPIVQKIFTTVWISTTTPKPWTGIDLTNCTSYFDGCNNCSVKDGKPDACTLMYCETPGTPKCTQYATGNNWTLGLANPASVNCEKNWWTLEILEWTGGQYGMCHLPNGISCEERAYMRWECGAWIGNQNSGTSSGNEWPKACSMIAKVCPDGSSVGRWGPNCEFAPCPGTDSWTVCTQEYAPVCASVQVECIKAPCPPLEQTFGNKCMMNANKSATFLHDGECATK